MSNLSHGARLGGGRVRFGKERRLAIASVITQPCGFLCTGYSQSNPTKERCGPWQERFGERKNAPATQTLAGKCVVMA